MKQKKATLNLVIAPIGLIALIVFFALSTEYFFTVGNFLNILRQASINIIIAAGMTVVILTGGIDLSVGSVVALSACSVAQLNQVLGINIWLAVLLGILIGTLCGFLNGLIICYCQIPPFITTLGMQGIARGIALIITSGYPSKPFVEEYLWIGNGDLFGIPYMFIIAMIVLLVTLFFLTFTATGRYMFALGGSEEAASFSGINVKKNKIIAYTIIGLCCGIAAIVMSSRINSAPPAAGANYELNAIAAVVIGGTSLEGGEGSIWGSLLGAFIMAVLTNGLNMLGVNTSVQTALIGAVTILMVYIKNLGNKSFLQ